MALKLSPVVRLDLIDEVLDLSATALRMAHPDAATLALVTFYGLLDVSDDDLAADQLRLKAWIADQEEAANANLGGGSE